MNKLIRTALILSAIAAFSTFVAAQNKLSEEKRKLIAEVITVTKADQQYFEITDKMFESMEKMYPLILSQTIQNNQNLSPDEKKEMVETLDTRYKLFSQKFREKMPQRIDGKKIAEDLIYPLYDKFFTEKELTDLLAFYKSETGRKFVGVTPQLIAESGAISEKVILPQILGLVDEIVKEVFPELSTKSIAPPPAKNQND